MLIGMIITTFKGTLFFILNFVPCLVNFFNLNVLELGNYSIMCVS